MIHRRQPRIQKSRLQTNFSYNRFLLRTKNVGENVGELVPREKKKLYSLVCKRLIHETNYNKKALKTLQ